MNTTKAKSKMPYLMMAGMLAISLGACSNMSQSQQRVVSGAAIGAAAGTGTAVITGGCVSCGAAVGTAAGAATGYVVDMMNN